MPPTPPKPQRRPARQLYAGPMDCRAAVVPSTIDAERRTFEVSLGIGAPVVRQPLFDDAFVERLEVSRAAVNLDRLNNGAPFVLDHGQTVDSVAGVVERAWVDEKASPPEIRAEIRLSARDSLAETWADIRSGILTKLSMRYSVETWDVREASAEGAMQERTATRWTPFEASLVAMGADDAAGIRGATDQTTPPEIYTATRSGPAPTPPSEDHKMDRTQHIEQAARDHGLDAGDAFVRTLLAGDLDAEQARAQIKGETARRATEAAARRAAASSQTPDADEVRRQAAADERLRIGKIEFAARACGLDAQGEFVRGLVARGTDLEAARAALIDEAARAQSANQPRTSSAQRATAGVDVGVEELTKVRSGIEQAIGLRMQTVQTENLDDLGREFRNLSLLDMIRELEVAGGAGRSELRRMDRMDLAARGLHSTSDFPNLLANVANKRLMDSFSAQARTFLPISMRNDAPDFRQISAVHLGGLSALEEVGESGEFKSATVGESKETAILRTYGKIVGFTRQSIINDDLGGFARIARQAGRSAGQLENNLVWALVTNNGAMGDGVAWFHNTHGNLATGGASALTADAAGLAALGVGFQKMAEQKDLSPDGTEDGDFINVSPRTLAVPPILHLIAKQLTTQVTPASAAGANTLAQDIANLIVEPRLGVASATAWYLFADPNQVDVVTYGYLSGSSGPVVETRNGFSVDGVEFKIRHDFYAMVSAYQGAFKSAGA